MVYCVTFGEVVRGKRGAWYIRLGWGSGAFLEVIMRIDFALLG